MKEPHSNLLTETRSTLKDFKTDDIEEKRFQEYLLKGVSRTFALTIPQLPDNLCYAVTNAYLLCRAVDTIEDEPNIEASLKREFCNRFIEVVKGNEDPDKFGRDLSPLLSEYTIPLEHELIDNISRVINITHSLDQTQRKALERCIAIMAEGMAFYQDNHSGNGLEDLRKMDRYCYYVAGVVGEMLTELFCHHNEEMNTRKNELMELAVSFGQGLQMTNILKDMWEDLERSACWLPRSIFKQNGYDLSKIHDKQNNNPGFEQGLVELIGIAHSHLKNAFNYTLMIPREESGIREFCLWAIGMAILTLQKINRNRSFTNGHQVKISRKSVKMIILASHYSVKNDRILKILFNLAGRGLPITPVTK